MEDETKYYYLKIKENFYDTEDIKILESMDNGYLYSNILMKMYLLSLKNGGKLMFKDKIPYNSKMLSTILNHNVDILDKAIITFKQLGLIEILDSGAIFMLDIQNYIGKSSDEADRIRKYRKKISDEKGKLLQMYDKSTTNFGNNRDIDINKDIDINIIYNNKRDVKEKIIQTNSQINTNKDIKSSKNTKKETKVDDYTIKSIIEYLNLKTNKKFKYFTEKTKRLITLRINEGFNLDDFYTVIDNQSKKWLDDDEMNVYLRPETLFSNHFESYLNQKQKNNTSKWFNKPKIDTEKPDEIEKQEMKEILKEIKEIKK